MKYVRENDTDNPVQNKDVNLVCEVADIGYFFRGNPKEKCASQEGCHGGTVGDEERDVVIVNVFFEDESTYAIAQCGEDDEVVAVVEGEAFGESFCREHKNTE